jgi:hypothetical protein
MNEIITVGSTSQLTDVFMQDSTVTTGAGKTGLAYNTVTCYYKRQGESSWTAVSLVTMTQGTWTTRGFIEGDATHAPGMYEFGIPDACLAAGAKWCDFMFTATGAAPCPMRVMLTVDDLQNATKTADVQTIKTRAITDPGGTVAIGTNVAQVGSAMLITAGTSAGQLDVTSGVVKSNLAQILGTALTETAGGYLAAAFKKFLDVVTPVFTAASVNQTGDAYARVGVAGAGLTAIGDTRLATLIAGLTPVTGAVADAAATTTTFITNLASSVTNFYKGQAVVFTSGDLTGQLGQIASYNGSTKAITVQSALTSAPANLVTFVIVNVAASRKWADVLATAIGTDSKVLVSADAQDLNATFSVKTKALDSTLQAAVVLAIKTALYVDPTKTMAVNTDGSVNTAITISQAQLDAISADVVDAVIAAGGFTATDRETINTTANSV